MSYPSTCVTAIPYGSTYIRCGRVSVRGSPRCQKCTEAQLKYLKLGIRANPQDWFDLKGVKQ